MDVGGSVAGEAKYTRSRNGTDYVTRSATLIATGSRPL